MVSGLVDLGGVAAVDGGAVDWDGEAGGVNKICQIRLSRTGKGHIHPQNKEKRKEEKSVVRCC